MENKKKVQVCILAPQNNNFYLLRLKTNKKRGGFWQNVTGGVDKDEEFDQAAIREFEEETSLDEDCIKKIIHLGEKYIYRFEDRWNKKVEEHSFCFVLSERTSITIDPSEHDEWEWKEVTKVNKNDFGFESNFEVFKASWENI